jgi:hypothetical protein
MTNITGIRENIVTRSRSVAGEVSKPLYAWIGVGDAALAQVIALPARAQARLKDLPDSPAAVRRALETYGALARTGYDELARRGERVVGSVRGTSESTVVLDDVTVDEPSNEKPSDEEPNSAEAPVARAARKTGESKAARKPRRTNGNNSAQRQSKDGSDPVDESVE